MLWNEAARGQVPAALAEKPTLRAELTRVWLGWLELSAQRTRGMDGPERIPLRDMLAWLDLEGVTDREARRQVCDLWRSMDGVFFDWLADRRHGRNPLPRSQS